MSIQFSSLVNSTFLKLLFFLLCTTSLYSQEKGDHHHAHTKNELGLGIGPSYNLDHQEWGVSTHFHYTRKFNAHSNWSVATGFEYVKSHEDHFTIELGVNYLFFDRLTVGALPGITFSNDESEKKSFGSVHFEAIYSLFHFGRFHLGPAVDFTLSKHEKHLTIGAHTGFCF